MCHSYFCVALIALNAVVCADPSDKDKTGECVCEWRGLPLSRVTTPRANYANTVNTTSRITIIRKICPKSLWDYEGLESKNENLADDH